MLLAKLFQCFSVTLVLIFGGKNNVYGTHFPYYTLKIRNIFNKIDNLTKIIFKSNLYNSVAHVATCTGSLYELQLVQNLNLYITYIFVH